MKEESTQKQIFKQEFKKRCFRFSLSILKLTDVLPKNQINRSLIDQLIRSATSIGANVVEGGNSSSKKEFINYFLISLKSTSETLYWLALVREVNPGYKMKVDDLISEATQIKKMLSTIILNTRNNSKLYINS
ncbi:MAG TPA: four helix bundle protein [Patescibacteria group bacterium]|nr:four helix bundle protein [Patescibacteria group bacterium]